MSGIAIGIDIGTSGVRAALVDAGREPVGWGAAPVAADQRRDPMAWWRGVEQALDALRATADLAGVRAIAVDGTSGTVVGVDAAGAPLGPASMYNDAAAPALVARVAAAAPLESAAHSATSPLAKLLTMQDTPGIARMLHQADWVLGRLCGRFDVSDENNALKTGYDPISRSWPAWLDSLGARRALLPRVVEPGAVVAPLTPGICARFGLPRDAVAVAGTTDGCAAFLATGAAEAGTGSRRSAPR